MSAPVKPEVATIERPDGRDVKSSVKEAARSARAAVAAGQIPRELDDPAIAIGAPGVLPTTGAGAHEGERPATTTVTFTDEEPETVDGKVETAVADAPVVTEEQPEEIVEEVQPETEEEREERLSAMTPEDRAAAEAEEASALEWPVVELPPVRDGRDPLAVEVEDAELAAHLAALSRGALRRDQLQRAMAEVEQSREELARLQDTMRIDPVNFVVEQLPEPTQIEMAMTLLSQPKIWDAVVAVYGELDEQGRHAAALEAENERLRRRGNSSREIDRLSQMRQQGREVGASLTRAVPDDFDERRAALLQGDLRRDVAEYVTRNGLSTLRVDEILPIIEARLELYGVDPAEANERMMDTGTPPLPSGARAARRVEQPAPARRAPEAPARTGKTLVAQVNARRRAGAVPGGGAGVPATGPSLPRKQTVKERLASMRDAFLGR